MFAPSLDIRTVTAALRDLGHDKADVRAAAARDLRHAGTHERTLAVDALVTTLRDPHPEVRLHAASALGELRATTAVPALLATAEDDLDEVREFAWMALGAIGSPDAIGAARRALRDPNPRVRFQVVIAVARVAPRSQAIDALLAATDDPDPLVCHIALRMAEELGGDDLPVAEPILDKARELLNHEDPIVRVASAVIRARAGLRDAIPTVLAVVDGALTTTQAEDEAAAIELTGELGLSEAKRALRRRTRRGALGLGGDPFAWQARVALARLGDPRASAWILGELRAWNRERRTLGVAAAGRAKLHAARPLLEGMRGDASRADPDAVLDAIRLIDGA